MRGFFKWLESKTYKMHVRVLLSRYRAYTTCPICSGGRFQPETLNYQTRRGADVRMERNRETAATLCRNLPRSPISQARDLLARLDSSA